MAKRKPTFGGAAAGYRSRTVSGLSFKGPWTARNAGCRLSAANTERSRLHCKEAKDGPFRKAITSSTKSVDRRPRSGPEDASPFMSMAVAAIRDFES